ncbi:MAG: hypothetical protein M1833_005123 [Piccolia ochrophora]|nr:MAG: hypothetical protein M1833_005123 [Piccolia ochrophora]
MFSVTFSKAVVALTALLCLDAVSASPLRRLPRAADISKFALPRSEGERELPAPQAGLTLKMVTIGRGTQNYTCADSTTAATPAAVGAVATLYDGSFTIRISEPFFHSLPGFALGINEKFLKLLPNTGKHYFDAADGPGVATFDLGNAGLFKGKKNDNVPAPKKAHPGVKKEGAVDWLQLNDIGASKGFKQTYRVQTAGGKPPATCDKMPRTFEVPYASEYWFYG